MNNELFTEGDLIKLIVACLESKSDPAPYEKDWKDVIQIDRPKNNRAAVSVYSFGQTEGSLQIRVSSSVYGGQFSLPLLDLVHRNIQGVYEIEGSKFMIARTETTQEALEAGKLMIESAYYSLVLAEGRTLPKLGSVEEFWNSAMREDLDDDKSPVRRLSDLLH